MGPAIAVFVETVGGQFDDETAAASRGYIQHWLADEQPPDRAIQQVFTAADRILRAGRMPVVHAIGDEGGVS
jgi:hypothetical protein